MKSKRNPLAPLILSQVLLIVSISLASSISSAGDYGKHAMKSKDIVATAVAAGNFNTLATALQAAGLVDTLQSTGPFTVFAPTDEAFAKLPEGTVEMLLQPENRDKLIAVLTYHVVPGRVDSGQVVNLSAAKTVNGQELSVGIKDGSVLIDNATVLAADIKASNGIIHVIDSVMLPKS